MQKVKSRVEAFMLQESTVNYNCNEFIINYYRYIDQPFTKFGPSFEGVIRSRRKILEEIRTLKSIISNLEKERLMPNPKADKEETYLDEYFTKTP